MRIVNVNTDRPYDIIISPEIINTCGEYIRKVSKAEKAVVVTDSNVGKLYLDRVVNSLQQNGFDVDFCFFKAGEERKNIDTVNMLYNSFADFHLTRKDLVIALGGGVTGDMAGFAAATYMRGVDYVQIPTSLLAQVDSSVGGKTGYDLPQGKNLVGAFWQPRMVLIDPTTLKTLPQEYIEDGMAEVIKYGCIMDKNLFELLEKENAMDIIEDIIETCVSIKRDVVVADEKEQGTRMLLNFGHTIGHALEKIYDYKVLSHGQAVAIGMVAIAKAGEKAGLTKKGTIQKIKKLCKKYNLPTKDGAPVEKIALCCTNDKKSSGSNINLVLLKEIGESFIHTIPTNTLQDLIS